MFSSDSARGSGAETFATTIVGGRPPTSAQALRQVPRGIEVLLKKAAIDPDFRALLLSQRSKVSESISLKLDETEATVIDTLPEKSLAVMIERAEVPHSQRKAFLGCVAATMLAALGLVDTSDAEIRVTGILPDRPGIKPILSWQGSKEQVYDIYCSEDNQSWTYLATVTGIDGTNTYADKEANYQGLPSASIK